MRPELIFRQTMNSVRSCGSCSNYTRPKKPYTLGSRPIHLYISVRYYSVFNNEIKNTHTRARIKPFSYGSCSPKGRDEFPVLSRRTSGPLYYYIVDLTPFIRNNSTREEGMNGWRETCGKTHIAHIYAQRNWLAIPYIAVRSWINRLTHKQSCTPSPPPPPPPPGCIHVN